MNDLDPPMLPPTVERVRGVVYHYTTRDGFRGAMERGEFWASEAASLNDLTEIRYGWDLIEKWLESQPWSATIGRLRRATDPTTRPSEVFILSASRRDDDANQWRLYGDDGRGYAMGIATGAPLSLRRADDRGPSDWDLMFDDVATVSPWLGVTYDDAQVALHLEALATDFEEVMRSIEETDYRGDPEGGAWEEMTTEEVTFAAIATIAALSKPPGFSGEDEARIVATVPHGPTHYRFRTGDAGVYPYIPLVHQLSGRTTDAGVGDNVPPTLPLTQVCLGPRLRQENVRAIELLLQARGYENGDTDVKTSQVPLR